MVRNKFTETVQDGHECEKNEASARVPYYSVMRYNENYENVAHIVVSGIRTNRKVMNAIGLATK